MSTIPKDRVIDTLVRGFSPYLGATMAGAAVRGVCDRLGGAGPGIDRARVDAILAALEPGLHVYLGRDRSRHVMDLVRADLAALEGGS